VLKPAEVRRVQAEIERFCSEHGLEYELNFNMSALRDSQRMSAGILTVTTDARLLMNWRRIQGYTWGLTLRVFVRRPTEISAGGYSIRRGDPYELRIAPNIWIPLCPRNSAQLRSFVDRIVPRLRSYPPLNGIIRPGRECWATLFFRYGRIEEECYVLVNRRGAERRFRETNFTSLCESLQQAMPRMLEGIPRPQ